MLHKFEHALDFYFIFAYQYCFRRINTIFGSENDSKSNLSLSDLNVDTDLSDIEVQEFSEEESGESESEDSKSDNNSVASDELRLIASNSRKFFSPTFL